MDGAGPLFDAIKTGNGEEVSRLVDGNAAPLGARQSGVSPLLTAVYYRQAAIARLLLDRGTPLDVFEASAVGDAERVRELLAGEPIRANEFAADGFTPLGPLHSAAGEGREEMVRLLLAHGADGAARSDAGKTPADMARERGHDTITELLGSR